MHNCFKVNCSSEVESHVYTATTDYSPVDQLLTFQSNARRCVNVATSDDEVLEFSETFQISMMSTSDADVILGGISSAIITILNDDSKLF